MIQVVLVDDELWVRTRLKSLIDWENMGYHICAEFSDGDVAETYLKHNYQNVQILITDIRMNKMNGDKLVEVVYHNYPDICVIVLSGFDDYEYVRNTLKNGALDYLVKNNLTEDILLGVLKNAREKLGKRMIRPSEENIRQLKNKFIENLITGLYIDQELVINTIKNLNLNLETRNVTAVLLLIENYKQEYHEMSLKERTLFEFTVQNMVDEILAEEANGIMGSLENGEFVLLLSFGKISSSVDIRNRIIEITKRIGFCLKQYLNKTASFIVGSTGSIFCVEKSFLQARKKSEKKFFHKDKILFWDENSSVENSEKKLKLSFTDEQKIQKAVKDKDQQQLQKKLDRIFTELQEMMPDRSECMRVLNDLIILASRICRESNIELQKISGLEEDIYEYVSKLEGIDECRVFYSNLFLNIISEIELQESDKKYSVYTCKALRFMQEHYREDISQTDIADSVGISPAYLSTLFKQDTGMGCKEYLLNLKLEHIKDRLEVGGKLKEILEEEGFTNYPYFFRCFKKKYGVTPKEYKNR